MPRPEWIDPICRCLQAGQQRATYAALAEAIEYTGPHPGQKGGAWMSRRQRAPLYSWIVAKRTGLPSGYVPAQHHPNLAVNPYIIEDGAELEAWLDENCPNWRGNA